MTTIKILGPGCANCKNLEKQARKALDELGLDAEIVKVTDFPTIASYGIMKTPGLVIDEDVVLSGRVAKSDEIAAIVKERI
ncbi:thioredoxin family protein [Corynebacterium sp. SCR221107]|uniref:thioredoxin family protein n=1 Tax=Corynebacterium sp. SCR221107 TaxID=3017361 RepID=UPI0022EC5D93|nr:thioredoxin family protein [Corynebacterium sp. SCR221107]WBT09905.1 thioredoxin family protein [Corynebacterium sp. SCR221107]